MRAPSLTFPLIGFAASLMLTLAAYAAVLWHLAAGVWLVGLLLALAVAQLIVQLVFFLYLGADTASRWRALLFAATIGFVFVVVAGSIWIMQHLNYNMMASPSAMQKYIGSQQGF